MGADATAISLVSNATAGALVRLCGGAFGERPTRDGHTLLAVNPSWTTSADVGQFWEGRLRAQAAPLLEGAPWEAVYVAEALRRPNGGTALLLRAWPGGWRLLDGESGAALGAWEVAPDDVALRNALRMPKR